MYKKIFLSSFLIFGLQQLNAQPLELTPVIGKNFFDSDTTLKNANFFGIRASQYISCDTALQFGYDRISSADFKHGSAYYDERSLNANTEDNSNNNTPENGYTQNSSQTQKQDTDIDRFFVNVLQDMYFPNPNIQPFIFAGLGYERVDQETNRLKSQGFVDAGAGLKIPFADNVHLYSAAKVLKKFDDSSLDIAIALGLGFTFGQTIANAPVVFHPTQEVVELQPESTSIIVQEPQQESIVKEAQPVIIQNDTASLAGEYYVQLAATFHSELENSNNHYIQALKETGEPFRIKNAMIHGQPAQLLLAGPYMSYQDARSALPQMRRIERGAFVKHIRD